MDSNTRSIAKAISYRVLGSVTTACIVYSFSGDMRASAVVKLGLYFVHERIWNHIPLGRPKPPEYEI
ncbi:MAG: DUF2061 domain-containing protein [Acidobacteria bacterium]|nr:DUF2061 domain-containing protein [Acidobacteriota bacterium]